MRGSYLEFFRVEPLRDLVLDDGAYARLDVVQHVFKLELALKGGRGNGSAAQVLLRADTDGRIGALVSLLLKMVN